MKAATPALEDELTTYLCSVCERRFPSLVAYRRHTQMHYAKRQAAVDEDVRRTLADRKQEGPS